MNGLLIGPAERAALAKLRSFAAQHPIEMQGLLARLADPAVKAMHLRRMGRQTIKLPTAFAVTFSIETGHPCGVARHMSMSTDRAGRAPSPEAVWMVAEELGFVDELQSCAVWLEDIGDGEKAVNVVQPIAGASQSELTGRA